MRSAAREAGIRLVKPVGGGGARGPRQNSLCTGGDEKGMSNRAVSRSKVPTELRTPEKASV